MARRQVETGGLIERPTILQFTGAIGNVDRWLTFISIIEPIQDATSEQGKLLFDFENVVMQGLTPYL